MRLAQPAGNSIEQLAAWARRLVDDLSRISTIEALPTFANDIEASNGNLKVGQAYVDDAGIVRRRVA
jgi:hypothetical protein